MPRLIEIPSYTDSDGHFWPAVSLCALPVALSWGERAGCWLPGPEVPCFFPLANEQVNELWSILSSS